MVASSSINQFIFPYRGGKEKMTDVVEAVVATPVEDVQAVEPVPEPVAHTPEPVTVPAEPLPYRKNKVNGRT